MGYRTLATSPKSAKSRRVVALDSETVGKLRSHRASQAAEKLAFGPGYQDGGQVFTRADGTPLHPEFVSKRFVALGKSAGVPRITLHSLRHTHVAILAATEVPTKVISERLGHASAHFTLDRYGHVLPGAQDEAAERFAAAVRGR